MRRIVLSMFVTLDGKISGPSGELDWMPGNVTPDREVDLAIGTLLDGVDTLLLGRVTYELFVDFWPTATTEQEAIADKLNARTKVVFSNTLASVRWGRWNNARLAQGSISEEIERLKGLPGKDMVIFGGASLAQAFMGLGLIDDYRLIVTPIVLGSGKPLFAGTGARQALELVATERFTSGAVLLRYRPPARR